jgi:uncharacterized protein YjiS (DUF1127 family)
MSCGNGTCTSIHYRTPVSASLPHLRWSWQLPLEWLTKTAQYCERRSQRRELLELNDQLLADIGLSRHQVAEDALKDSRTRLTMWHVHR